MFEMFEKRLFLILTYVLIFSFCITGLSFLM